MASQVPTTLHRVKQENPQLWWVFSPVQIVNSEGTAHHFLGLTEVSSSVASASLRRAQGVQEPDTAKEGAGPRPSCSSYSQLLDTPLGSRDSWHRLGSQRFSINKEKCNGEDKRSRFLTKSRPASP